VTQGITSTVKGVQQVAALALALGGRDPTISRDGITRAGALCEFLPFIETTFPLINARAVHSRILRAVVADRDRLDSTGQLRIKRAKISRKKKEENERGTERD